ncbi:hypothetical protein [uncultured Microscilla sp.]|uniref:hypothetical protein n=1 Tax=uncultured Microscilla sp. TaxID=432653 RepID=UPI00261542BB|nr:hypothetical protein [uncultured Microscilla sp.]
MSLVMLLVGLCFFISVGLQIKALMLIKKHKVDHHYNEQPVSDELRKLKNLASIFIVLALMVFALSAITGWNYYIY